MNLTPASTFLAIGLATGLMVSCTTPPRPAAETASAPAWPPPPSEARIVYVQSLHGPHDVGQKPSFFHSVANWITGGNDQSRDLKKPFAVAIDEKGDLCFTDTDARIVGLADFTHKHWRRYAAAGKTKFSSPVAVARRNGIFYVADSGLAKVFAFGDDGKTVFEISEPLMRPVGLAIAGDTLFVVDSQAHAILAFGLDGKFRFRFGKRGNGPGDLNFPTCAAPDNRGHLLVSDTLNSRVEVFDLHGGFVSQFGSNGDTSGHFARPKGIAVDAEGHSYVIDGMFNNFQVFDAQGTLLLDVAQAGTGPGELSLPHGIAISADNRIYVADAFNRRIQVFKYLEAP